MTQARTVKRKKAKPKRRPNPSRYRKRPAATTKGKALAHSARFTGLPAQAETSEEAKRAELTERALDLKIAGASYRQIGKQLGISDCTAHKYVMGALDEIREANQALAEKLREMEVRRGERYLLKLQARIQQGDPAAISTALKIGERKSRLLGLDVRPADTIPLEQALTLVRGIAGLFLEVVEDTELRRAFAKGLRRQVGPLALPDIAVQATTGGEATDRAGEGA